MIDRAARDELRDRLARIHSGDLKPKAITTAPRMKTSDSSIEYLVEELTHDLVLRLPHSPQDDLTNLTVSARRRVERAMRFLETDLEYVDPDGGWNWSGIVVTGGLVAGVLILLARWTAGESIAPVTADWLLTVSFALIGLALGTLALAYVVALAFMGIYIFRVRVLRQNLERDDPDDFWPFASRAEYESLASSGLLEPPDETS